MVHRIKTLTRYFERAIKGQKTFELRYNDRDYQVGDVVYLCEWDHENQAYTGSELGCEIIYVLHGPLYGLSEGWCIFGFKVGDE